MLLAKNFFAASRQSTGWRPLEWTPERLAEFGAALLAYLRANPDALFIEEFAHQYDPPFALSEIKPYLGQDDCAEFTHQYTLAREMVRVRLIMGAMVRDQYVGKYGTNLQSRLNPGFTRFILACEFGMHALPKQALTQQELQKQFFGNGVRLVMEDEDVAG